MFYDTHKTQFNMLKCEFLGNILYPKSYIGIDNRISATLKVNFMKTIRSLFFLINFISYSQEISEIKSSIPEIFPVSPQAASLGNYGSVPINYSTGKINYAVPIYNIQIGDFNFPINLSYNYSGLVAEEDAAIVGLGWTLNATGVITRQVFSKPDESLLGYIGNNMYDNEGVGKRFVAPYHRNLLDESEELDLFENSANGRWDTEPDRFIIQSNVLQASFYLNEDAKPIFLPQKNYITEFTDGFQGKINITDDKGISYVFGFKENTLTENILVDGSQQSYVSSWYLERILFPDTKGEILFEYDTYEYHKTSFSDSKNDTQGSCGDYDIPQNVRVSQTETSINALALKKITFPKGEVYFNNTLKNSSESSSGGAVLNSIEIKNSAGNTIDTYVFDYNRDNPDKIKLLTEIRKENSDKILPYYRFDYYGVLPEEISYSSQDVWGFYNGQTNINLVDGNRKESFEHTVIGALRTIHYPTGGFTEIEYEQNEVSYGSYPLTTNCSALTTNKEFYFGINSAGEGQKEGFETLTIPLSESVNDQIVKVTLRASTGGIEGISESEISILGYNKKAPCDPLGINNVSSYREGTFIATGPQSETSYFEIDSETNFLTINYRVNSTNGIASCSIKIEYFDPTESERNARYVGGIRVKKIRDYSDTNNHTEQNIHYINEGGETSGLLLNRPFYNTKISHVSPVGQCVQTAISARSNIPLSTFSGSPVLYKRVEILSNPEMENGKIINYYSGNRDLPGGNIFAHRDNKNWRKGSLEKVLVFNATNDTLELINSSYKTLLPYDKATAMDNKSIALSFKARQKTINYTIWMGQLARMAPQSTSEFSYSDFSFLPEFYKLEHEFRSHYFDNQKLLEQKDFLYHNRLGYIKELFIKNGSQESKMQSFKYCFEESDNILTDFNMLSSPILTESYLVEYNISETPVNTKISTKRVDFKQWSDGIIQPQIIKTSKGDEALEERLRYLKYDRYGNPLEVARSSGVTISYVWSYNQQYPVARIENATFSEIATALGINETELMNFDQSSIGTLDALRSHPDMVNAIIVTYDYKPLVGVTKITDPRGYTTTYDYDKFNRLEFIKDELGNLISENKYQYLRSAN